MKSFELDRWNRAQALLEEVLDDTSEPALAAALEKAAGCGCGAEFTALLAALDSASALDRPLDELIREMVAGRVGQGALTGRVFGQWMLGEEIGRGGMSVVYHAQRTEGGFEQQAALKILSLTFASQGLLDSFLRERQILSGLRHPGIARLIDGGVTTEGSPFLVMEYVDGQRIDRWCQVHKPGVRLIVQMVKQLADAVAYAQQRLVVHRDINASNVLVDEHGRPVLIDFGIAGLLGADQGHTLHAFTPKFAAPEQVAGESSTTATDVFALGRLLESLLPAGSADPELRCLLGVATTAEPGQRYANALELAEDLEAWLEQRPMRARPPSLRYRASRFIVRHRWAVAATALVLLSLLGGFAASMWQARIAAIERDLARAESARATQVTAFLKRLFDASDPDQARGKAITARQLLDQGAFQVRNTLDATPGLKIEMLILLGDLYRELDELPSAEPLLADALARAESLADVSLQVEALRAMAELEMSRQAHEESLALAMRAEQLLAAAGQVPGRQHASLMQGLLFSLAELGRVNEAVERGEVVLQAARQMKALAASALYEYLYNVANALVIAERETEAEPLLLEAMQLDTEAATNPSLQIAVLASLSSIAIEKGQVEKSLHFDQQAMALADQIYPPQHSQRARQLSNMATALVKLGRLDEAVQALQEALGIYVGIYGDKAHPRVAAAYNNLGRTLADQGKYAEAAEYSSRARTMAGELFGRDDPRFAIATGNLGDLYRRAGDLQPAEELLLLNLEMRRNVLGAEHRSVGSAMSLLAMLRLDQQRFEEALELCDAALDMFERIDYQHALVILNTRLRRARSLAGLGRTKEAAREFQGLFELAESAGADVAIAEPELLAAHAAFLLQQEDPNAPAALQQAIEAYEAAFGETHPDTLRLKNLEGQVQVGPG